MKTQFYIRLAIHVILAWATVFVATYHQGITTSGVLLLIAAMLIAGGNNALAYMADPNAAQPLALPKVPPAAGVVALMLGLFLLSGCAHTSFAAIDRTGKPHCIAHFEGDMQGQSFAYNDGTTKFNWNCTTVNHSTATAAQGTAAHLVLGGVATMATATGAAVATSGLLPGGISSLFHW